MTFFILGASIVIQLIAAGLALRLVKLTGFLAAWIFIATALLFMSVRRSIVLYDMIAGDTALSFNFPAELTALFISVLMLCGVILIRPVVMAFRHTEDTLRESEAIYRGILDNMTDTYYRTDRDGLVTMGSASAQNLLGYALDEMVGKPLSQLYVYPKDREIFLARLREKGSVQEYESLLLHKDGTQVLVETNAHLLRDAGGNITGVEGTVRNVTERKKAEQLNTRLGRIIEDSVNEVYIFNDETLTFILVNRGARRNLGYSMEELSTLTPVDIKPEFTLDEFNGLIQPLREADAEVVDFETVHRRKDGSTYPVEIHLQYTRAETPALFFAIVQDITERKQSEEQLSQAHKMEAIGQLTGGIAHDFNNLLTVILGNIELARVEADLSRESALYLDESFKAAENGATLTQRLLAFSRKQALRPEVIDLRVLISGMGDLLRRTLREDIEIEIVGGGRLWRCEADPAQLENALLNLAINARDAMEGGGKLTIETSNAYLDEQFASQHREVDPGQYVLMAVSDTGVGMSLDIRSRVFDPFFTTKEEGKGSGLGLSMVYGFVKQSGGSIDIYSEVGEGTTIKIYLPRAYKEVEVRSDVQSVPDEVNGTGEVILVVEDNHELRKVVTDMLSSLGYTPLNAPDVQEAVNLMEHSTVDLLLTDIILPGWAKGTDLVEVVEERWPETLVVYMSGYTENAVIHDGRLDPGIELLSKPFSKQQLARKMAQMFRQKQG
jgi:PAS domain S-box-containing protein